MTVLAVRLIETQSHSRGEEDVGIFIFIQFLTFNFELVTFFTLPLSPLKPFSTFQDDLPSEEQKYRSP